jgi:hypothetical protein
VTQVKSAPVTARKTTGTTRAPVRRHPGDTQSILVVLLTIAATAVAMYDLFLLTLIAR